MVGRMLRAIALTTVLLGWSSPSPFVHDRAAGRVAAGTDGRGAVVAVWQHDTDRLQPPRGPGGYGGFESVVRARTPAGPQTLSIRHDLTATPTVAVNPRGDAIAAWTQAYEGRRFTILAASRRPGGRFGRREAVGRTGRFIGARPIAGINARGDGVLLWARGDRMQVALRRRGHDFGRPESLPGTRPVPAGAALDAAGRAWVAWVDRGRVFVAERPPGERFGRPRVLNPDGPGAGSASLALGADGTVAVAWGAGGAAHAAIRTPGGAFGLAQTVATFMRAGGRGETPVAVTPLGEVLVAWTEAEPDPLGERSHVAVASRPAGGAFGPRRLLSAPEVNAEFPALGVEGGGAVVAAWRQIRSHDPAAHWSIGAAVRPVGADWAAAESIGSSAGGIGPPRVLSARATTRLLWQPSEGGALVTRRLGP